MNGNHGKTENNYKNDIDNWNGRISDKGDGRIIDNNIINDNTGR